MAAEDKKGQARLKADKLLFSVLVSHNNLEKSGLY